MEHLRFSRYSHLINIKNSIAIYNSLNLALTYISSTTFKFLNQFLSTQSSCKKNEDYQPISDLINMLVKQRILVKVDENEIDDYLYWKGILPALPIGILYLLLTDNCNFACKYCVIEGGIPQNFKHSNMSISVAKQGIDLFSKVISCDHSNNDMLLAKEPTIIIYGGEPLLNRQTLKFVLEYIQELKKKSILPQGLGITVNTNASLVTEEIASLLADYQVAVSVSLDGKHIQHDLARKYKSEHGTFNDVIKGFQLLRQAGAKVSLSCTLGWHNLDVTQEILEWFIEILDVKGLGFNIMVDSKTMPMQNIDEYAEKVSNVLIQCFKFCRERGVYEDRMMRKAKAFVDGRLYINDCAGCGQQIVVAPDGQLGTCQAYTGTRKYFIDFSSDPKIKDHPIWQEWGMRSPLNMPQCEKCIALGICGGGCPHNADQRTGSIWNVDEVFCVHAKKALSFFIEDLFITMGKNNVFEQP
jgi:uncharacterized protein